MVDTKVPTIIFMLLQEQGALICRGSTLYESSRAFLEKKVSAARQALLHSDQGIPYTSAVYNSPYVRGTTLCARLRGGKKYILEFKRLVVETKQKEKLTSSGFGRQATPTQKTQVVQKLGIFFFQSFNCSLTIWTTISIAESKQN